MKLQVMIPVFIILLIVSCKNDQKTLTNVTPQILKESQKDFLIQALNFDALKSKENIDEHFKIKSNDIPENRVYQSLLYYNILERDEAIKMFNNLKGSNQLKNRLKYLSYP